MVWLEEYGIQPLFQEAFICVPIGWIPNKVWERVLVMTEMRRDILFQEVSFWS